MSKYENMVEIANVVARKMAPVSNELFEVVFLRILDAQLQKEYQETNAQIWRNQKLAPNGHNL